MATIQNILQAAVRREEEANEFYTRMAARCKDAFVRQLFTQLAGDELGHKAFLLGCLNDPDLLKKLSVPVDCKVAEATPAVDGADANLKAADAVALAMKREQSAVEHYQQLAASAQSDDYRRAFEGLANMELNHKKKLEDAFINVGYPEVF
ncbi:MAG: ferritin family protein [Pontiellaceae bacterium]|jgi:rubrerythrin|nr:ferritin family protein [Pontiellaceae bacterium]